MVNLKLGGMLFVVGAVMFVLSDTFFGESEAASYSAFLGLILLPLGIVLSVVGLLQLLFAKVKERRRN